jgi:Zn-dependent peptidase ImmA (M78 family)/DNA-binding XRE family transcriptional regulator
MKTISMKRLTDSSRAQRLILARESRGLLQGELATEIGVTQGKISKMESELLDISDETIEKISKVLAYPVSFFTEKIEIYPLGINYFRKNTKLPPRKFRAIEAFVNIRRNEIEKLLRSVEYNYERQIPLCDIDDDRYGSPEVIANSLRQFWNIPRGPINNVIDLLESAGVIIVPSDFGTRDFSGVKTWTNDGVNLIFINKDMPSDRLRFTLVHELGHIVMHRLTNELMEKEADRFASEFLMPSDQIRHQLLGISLDKLGGLKLHWKVSMSSLLVKAKALDLITDRQYSYLWSQMAAHGYRRNEPAEYNVPKETPSLLGEMISTHLQELGFSIDQLTDMLKLEKDEFLEVYGLQKPEQKKPTSILKFIS